MDQLLEPRHRAHEPPSDRPAALVDDEGRQQPLPEQGQRGGLEAGRRRPLQPSEVLVEWVGVYVLPLPDAVVARAGAPQGQAERLVGPLEEAALGPPVGGAAEEVPAGVGPVLLRSNEPRRAVVAVALDRRVGAAARADKAVAADEAGVRGVATTAVVAEGVPAERVGASVMVSQRKMKRPKVE